MPLPSTGEITFQDLIDEYAGGNSYVSATTDDGVLGYHYSDLGLGDGPSWYIHFTDLSSIEGQPDRRTAALDIYPGMRVTSDNEYFPDAVVTSWYDTGQSVLITLRIFTPTAKLISEVQRGPNQRSIPITFHATQAQQFTRYDQGIHRYGLIPDINANNLTPSFTQLVDNPATDIDFSAFYGSTSGQTVIGYGPNINVSDIQDPGDFDAVFGEATGTWTKKTSSYYSQLSLPATDGLWKLSVSEAVFELDGEQTAHGNYFFFGIFKTGTSRYFSYQRNPGWEMRRNDTGVVVASSSNNSIQQIGTTNFSVNIPAVADLSVEGGMTYDIRYFTEVYTSGYGATDQAFFTTVRPTFTATIGGRNGRPISPEDGLIGEQDPATTGETITLSGTVNLPQTILGETSANDIVLGYEFRANGELRGVPQGGSTYVWAAGQWADQPPTGIYYVRFTQESGRQPSSDYSDNMNVWHQLNQSRYLRWFAPQSQLGQDRGTVKVEIATDAQGTDVVATGYYAVRIEGDFA